MKLSIIIPVYNEAKTILKLLDKVTRVDFGIDYEIIIIDDKSTDACPKILKNINNDKIKVVFQSKNQGKGSAIRKGYTIATGDIIVVQDADLEYNPTEIPKLIQPILQGKTSVVYGSRFLAHHTPGYFFYYLGNRLISVLFSLVYSQKVTDPYTCYKVFKKNVLDKIDLTSNGFEIEAEFTAKVLNNGYKILELPISYNSRTFAQGKKINWRDGVKAVYYLIKYKFFHD
ncbi:glycosyltransferase family 2 protein [Patescibacteria group bacterium]|nr:glycosyltransferase family 2 protein [Patescibacteria group bacterium]